MITNINIQTHRTWSLDKLIKQYRGRKCQSLNLGGHWLGSGWHFVRWPVCQPKSHLTKCKPNPKSDPGGGFNEIMSGDFICLGSGWHFVRWPVSQPAAIDQPVSYLTKCQPDPKSDLGGVSIFYISTQVTFCQMASQPANCYWPVNQPSDKMST